MVELQASGLRLLSMRAIRKVRRLVDLVGDFKLIVWFSQRLKRRDHDSDSDQWEIFYSSKSWTVPVSPFFNLVLFKRSCLSATCHLSSM